MTPDDLRAARKSLGLNGAEMARMLGVSETQVRRMEAPRDVASHREASLTLARLVRAYLDGYRPADWPHP